MDVSPLSSMHQDADRKLRGQGFQLHQKTEGFAKCNISLKVLQVPVLPSAYLRLAAAHLLFMSIIHKTRGDSYPEDV